MPSLESLATKARGLFGLGAIAATAGGLGGLLWGTAMHLLGLGFGPWADVVGFGQGGVIAGAACGLGLGTLLATLEGRRSLEELPLWRMGALGAVLGVALPTAFMLLTSGLIHFVGAPEIVMKVLGSGAVLGALLSVSMVGLAQRAHRAELAAVEEVAALLEGD